MGLLAENHIGVAHVNGLAQRQRANWHALLRLHQIEVVVAVRVEWESNVG